MRVNPWRFSSGSITIVGILALRLAEHGSSRLKYSGGFMFKKMISLATLVMLVAALQTTKAQGQSSEDEKSRPDKQDIIGMMAKAAQMPVQQQNSRIEALWKDNSNSKTPRTDFLFCLGLAFWGNYKAQKCAGSAYEKGIGVVEDASAAFTWLALAAENKIDDKTAKEMIEAERERIKNNLLAAYPHPTEDELDDLIKAQKSQIELYQEIARKGK
jgi:TPR repeat protein